jgi:tetratricopeptide (TPR) repeat protein
LAKKTSTQNFKNQQQNTLNIGVESPFFSIKNMWWICFLLAFLFYGNSIKNGYSMDDEYVTTTVNQKNELTEKGIWGFGKIFTSHSFIDGKQNYEYRPVSIYTFAIEWSLFKNSENRVHYSHAINVILYALIGVFLFQLLQVLFQGKASTLSAVITILFMIHPIHSEVVNSIKNRDELLSLLFALLAAIQTFKWLDQKKIWRIGWIALFILLSLLSKKSNLPFIVSIPLMIYFFRDVQLKTIGITFLLLFSMKIGFNVFKNHFMGLNETTNRNFSYFENPLFEMDFIDRIPMFFYTNWLYIEKLILPYPLAFYYGFDAVPLVGFGDWQFYLGLIVMLVALYFAITGLRNKSLISFGILFFLLAIGGAANLLSPMVGIIAERFAFSASIGFCIVLAYLFSQWKKDEFLSGRLTSKLIIPLLIVILPSLVYSINRNSVWHSKKSLYLNDIKHVPNSVKANSLLGSEYQLEVMDIQKNGNATFEVLMEKVDSALMMYEKSLSLYGDYESNLNNRGVLLYTFYYDYEKALSLFKHSIKVNPSYKEGMLNCANSYAKLAEGFLELEKLNNSVDTNESSIKSTEKQVLALYFKNELFKTFAITKQFDLNIRDFAKKFSRDQLAFQIKANAQNLGNLSESLKKNSFASKMNDNVNQFIQSNPQGILNGILQFNSQIFNQILIENNITKAAISPSLSKLKNQYIDSAKIYFKKTHELSRSDKNIFQIEEKFAIQLNDYGWLISIQEQLIKEFPEEQHGPQYVQMGNGYLNLKQRDKALSYFQKGAQEFKKEKEALLKKTIRTQTEEDRLNLLTKELKNLKAFKEKILKGEI